MYFDLNDEQAAIKETARDFLASRYKPARVRELAEADSPFDESDWKEMAGLGWTGLAFPEEWGGQGLGMVDLAVVMEEMGYSLAPSPLFSNTIVGLALTERGTDDQRERYLRPLAEGELRGTPALFDAGSPGQIGHFQMEGKEDGDGTVLDGVKVLVTDAEAAEIFLVGTSDGRRHIVRRDAEGVTVKPQPSIDPTRRHSDVHFENVRVAAEDTLDGAQADFLPVFNRGCVALAAEQTGIAQRTLDMAVEYAKDRQQFGRPIGSYQAVSHRCAQMLLETENARSAALYAAWTADAEPESLNLSASMAKAYASDAGWRVADASIQVHGGIGFTWEHDLHFFLKRATANAASFGDAKWHRERVAGAILA